MRGILQPSQGRNASSGFGPEKSPSPAGAENPGSLAGKRHVHLLDAMWLSISLYIVYSHITKH